MRKRRSEGRKRDGGGGGGGGMGGLWSGWMSAGMNGEKGGGVLMRQRKVGGGPGEGGCAPPPPRGDTKDEPRDSGPRGSGRGGYLLSRFRSIIDVVRFNCSVRNGKRWSPHAMAALVR